MGSPWLCDLSGLSSGRTRIDLPCNGGLDNWDWFYLYLAQLPTTRHIKTDPAWFKSSSVHAFSVHDAGAPTHAEGSDVDCGVHLHKACAVSCLQLRDEGCGTGEA